MIANMLRIEAVRVLNAIAGPNEAMAEADFYRREEKRWRKWVFVGTIWIQISSATFDLKAASS